MHHEYAGVVDRGRLAGRGTTTVSRQVRFRLRRPPIDITWNGVGTDVEHVVACSWVSRIVHTSTAPGSRCYPAHAPATSRIACRQLSRCRDRVVSPCRKALCTGEPIPRPISPYGSSRHQQASFHPIGMNKFTHFFDVRKVQCHGFSLSMGQGCTAPTNRNKKVRGSFQRGRWRVSGGRAAPYRSPRAL